jgi:hypothetical protein
MRVILGSWRGILSGWLIAATVPLLANPRSIAAWTAAGLDDRSRIGLATVELLGAALFAFERTAAAGFALLLAAFVAVAVVHMHHREMPWWLAAYSLAGIGLLYLTRRARGRAIGPSA